MSTKKPKPEPLTLEWELRQSARDPNEPLRNEVLYVGETGSDPELRRAIMRELAPLASEAVKHRDAQAKKAKKPRSKMRELVAALKRAHPNGGPADVWPHLRHAIEDSDWANDCDERKDERGKPYYSYQLANGSRRTISLKSFAALLSEV